MPPFSFLSLKNALVLLRVSLALVFLAHAIVRIINGSIPQFGQFLTTKGLPAGTLLVWLITIYEIVGGLLLTLGRYVRWLSAGFVGLLLMGILLIHASRGWFVGEHGTGGSEYSVMLIVAFLVVAAVTKRTWPSPNFLPNVNESHPISPVLCVVEHHCYEVYLAPLPNHRLPVFAGVRFVWCRQRVANLLFR